MGWKQPRVRSCDLQVKTNRILAEQLWVIYNSLAVAQSWQEKKDALYSIPQAIQQHFRNGIHIGRDRLSRVQFVQIMNRNSGKF